MALLFQKGSFVDAPAKTYGNIGLAAVIHRQRAAILGHYECARKFPSDSEYGKYGNTGLGLKLRMHPVAAALARCQLKKLPKRNADGVVQTRRLNDRLIQLPGLYERQNRSDVERFCRFLRGNRASPSRIGNARVNRQAVRMPH